MARLAWSAGVIIVLAALIVKRDTPSHDPVAQPPPFQHGVTAQESPLYALSSRSSRLLRSLAAETEVKVLGRVFDGRENWMHVGVYGLVGFMPESAQVNDWESWARARVRVGSFEGMTPDLQAMVGGAVFPLFGVAAPQMEASASLARTRLALHKKLSGQTFTCTPKAIGRFACSTNFIDLGDFYIKNGAAVPGEGATEEDYEHQREARAERRGVYGE